MQWNMAKWMNVLINHNSSSLKPSQQTLSKYVFLVFFNKIPDIFVDKNVAFM